MAKRTTEQSKRTVRVLAIGGSVVALGGVGVAFAANPHPASTQQPDARLTALQQREATLARQAKVHLAAIQGRRNIPSRQELDLNTGQS
jgi:hypothetical protein